MPLMGERRTRALLAGILLFISGVAARPKYSTLRVCFPGVTTQWPDPDLEAA